MKKRVFLFVAFAVVTGGLLSAPAHRAAAQTQQRSLQGYCATPYLDAYAQEFEKNTQLLHPEVPYHLAKPAKVQYEVGDTVKFYVDNFVTNSIYQISAVCRKKTLRTYIFVGLEEWNAGKVSQTDVDNFDQAFEQETPPESIDPSKGIRDIETELFGPTPNKSGDGYVYILIYDIKDNYNPSAGKYLYVAGYFSPRDQGNGIYSNKKDLLYVDCDPANPSSKNTLGTIAHEFQHLIHHGLDPDEDLSHGGTWVNEGCSMYAEYITGYGLANPSRYLRHPDRSLISWNYGGDDVDIDYVKVALYFYYLHEKFGPSLISAIVKDPLHGVEGVSDAMQKQNIPISFDDVYANFAVANYADDPYIGPNTYYGYTHYDPPILPTVSKSHNIYPVDRQGKTLRRYATSYYRFTLADSTAELHFEATAASHIRPMIFEKGLEDSVYAIQLDSSQTGETPLKAIGKTASEVVLIPASLSSSSTYFYSVTTKVEDIWPPQITSGPRESLPTNTTTTIYWETDELSTSIVEYGETPAYGNKVESDELVVEHSVLLSNLKPNTTYHYRVGSVDNSGNGPTYSADFTFTTADVQKMVVATVQQAHSYGYEGRNIVRDSQGTLHLVYHEKVNDRRFVYHVQSSDDGKTWSDPVQIDDQLYYGGMPSIAVDAKDRLHVAWHAQAVKNAKFVIYYSRSDDGGQTWSAPKPISNTIKNFDQLYASVAIDTAGNPHVVWNTALYSDNFRGDVRYTYSKDGGNTWETDKEISISEAHLCFVPTIQFTPGDTAYVLYTDGEFDQHQRNAYCISSEDFETWTPPKAISTSGVLYDGMVSFVIDNIGRIHAVFADNFTPGDIRIMYTRGFHSNWTTPVPVAKSLTGGNVSYPSISVDNLNNLYLAYRDDMEGGHMGKLAHVEPNEEFEGSFRKPAQNDPGDVFLTVYRDGGWLPPVNLSNDSYDSQYPELPLRTYNNTVDLIWMNTVTSSSNQITYLHFNTAGGETPTPPIVEETYPANGAKDVPYFHQVLKIWARFDQRIVGDSLIPGNVIIQSAKNGLVAGEISYIESEKKFQFTPVVDLSPLDTITITLRASIKSAYGLPLDGNGNGVAEGSPTDDYSWQFVTGAEDHQPPVLTIGVLQNPVLTRYVDLYVVSSEALPALPTLTVSGEKVALIEINPDAFIYKGDFKLSESGVLALHAEAVDYAGNRGVADRGFTAQLLIAGQGGSLRSADGQVELIVPGPDVSHNLFVTVVRQPVGFLQKASPDDSGEPVYVFGPSSLRLAAPAELRFRPAAPAADGRVPSYTVEHLQQDGSWAPVDSKLRDGLVVATIQELGAYRLKVADEWIPAAFALRQNYPNPFSPRMGATTLTFDLPQSTSVTLAIYNLLGQRVRLLAEGKKPAGRYQLRWDGRDDAGRQVASGVYLIRLKTPTRVFTQKLLILQ